MQCLLRVFVVSIKAADAAVDSNAAENATAADSDAADAAIVAITAYKLLTSLDCLFSVKETCDFETDLCNWIQDDSNPSPNKRFRRAAGDNLYSWTRIQGSTVTNDDKDYRPRKDHTKQTLSGL